MCIWDVLYDPEEEGEDALDEYVLIANDGEGDQDMAGWTLCNEINHCYPFPTDFILESDAEVTVWTGSGTDTDDELYWGRGEPVWDNDGDTAYLMKDDAGTLVDCVSWP